MRVDIKEGGDGVACWNAEPIVAYAAAIDAREAALASANPDLDVTPGRVKCYGCQVNDFALGIRCTAELTRTLTAYSRSGLNARSTAKALGVSERTVRYRLDRLDALLGADFRSRLPELVLAVELTEALAVQRRGR